MWYFFVIQEYGMDEQDLAVLEYAFGLSEISTGLYKVCFKYIKIY